MGGSVARPSDTRWPGLAIGTYARPMRQALAWLGLCCACAPAGGSRPPVAPAPRFDPDVLLADTAALLEVPRVLGDPRRTQGIQTLRRRLELAGAHVSIQPHRGVDPQTGQRMELVNLYGSVRPDAPMQFVLATHFDVRPWAESDPDPERREQPIPGANDGTSGVVVLLALVPALRDALPPEAGFTVALFDGEELGRPGMGGYCAGSTYFSEHPETAPEAMRRARFGIVLDMVGDAELSIAREPNSLRQHPQLVETVWSTAAQRGERAFIDASYPHGIVDDHVFLSRAGIPSVLLIDYDYDAWHTGADDLEHVSGESLASVAAVVFHAVNAQLLLRLAQ